jgi:hypothetical protein
MSPDLRAHLDTLWAKRLHCEPATLHNEVTNIITDPQRSGVEVWLIGKTCVILAEPKLAQALKASIGTRNPIQAFEPGRLRDAIAAFSLTLSGPESILVLAASDTNCESITWIPVSESAAEIETATNLATASRGAAATGIPALAIPLKQRAARRAAEACGYSLYASVIYIGHHP